MPPAAEVMNTAVPGTRYGWVSARSCMNRSIGIMPAVICRDSSARPRRHVVIIVNTTAATASGNQPPDAILFTFATKNDRSNDKNIASTRPARVRDQPHFCRATA